MPTTNYISRRRQVHDYFDRTALDAWARMTSDVPLTGIRETVRLGRQKMFETLLSWLPDDLDRTRIYDAGCGTGKFSVELAQRGASVHAVDLSPKLIQLADERAGKLNLKDRVSFACGDMLSPANGPFDHVIAMDSLIHYDRRDSLEAIHALTEHAKTSVLFTFAPRTPMLTLMHSVGRLFPRSNRAPSIEPMTLSTILDKFTERDSTSPWTIARTKPIKNGFYISQAVELVRR